MRDYVINKELVSLGKKLGFSEVIVVNKRVVKSDTSKDRNLIESKKVDLIYDFEFLSKKDKTHYRTSGMNHVLAKLMHENNVSYGINLNSIINASKEEQSRIFGRMLQNVRLCKKYKVSIVIASFASNQYQMRDSKDVQAFARVLGI